MTTRKTSELTFKDRLSRLTYMQACKLLGAKGAKLIQIGGGYDVVLDEQVYLGRNLFRLKLPDAVATLTLKSEAPGRLAWNCTACFGACQHVGAAFSLVLEEKTALGLAQPPPERAPAETLTDEQLIEQALEERRQRAQSEKMTLKSMNASKPWTDYVITSAVSGKTYRVALRGEGLGDSYCSCPDFRKNTLGTCKHILHALAKVKRRFSASMYRRPYKRKGISVHVQYGEDSQLRLQLPEKLRQDVLAIVRPIRQRPIEDVHDLLGRVRKLERLGHTVTIYPDAEEMIQQRLFQRRIEALVAQIRKNPKDHPLRRQLLKTKLLPYQLDGIAFAVGAGRAVLADDMGLGKTIQGIGVAELLAGQAQITKVLVICPASLKSQWRSEVHRFSERDCQLVVGSAQSRARQYDNECFFTVCNYEQVLRDLLAIERVKWDLIILDEGQRIKNWQAKTTSVVKSLRSPFALVLSGTPLENRLDDLYSVVEFIDDRRLGPGFRFYHRHRVVDEKGKVLGFKNLDQLRENLKPVLLRRTRAGVMKQLPPRNTEVIRVAPTGEQLDLHSAQMRVASSILKKKYISEMDLLRLQKALLMCRLAADSTFLVDKRAPGYSSKLDALDDLLDRFSQEAGHKAVLFSEWTTMLGLIEPLLSKRGLAYVRLDGSVPQKKRHQLVHTFQHDPACRLFITTNAGSTGLNLQAANTVINVDLPWNPAVLEQRIARAHRMGQKRSVQVYVLVTEETIEEGLLATLSAKHQLALAALDPESDLDSVDLVSGIEELKRRLEVLLGAKPEAPIDESEKAMHEKQTQTLSQKDRIASAGGQLIAAAFDLLNELVPSAEGQDDVVQQQTAAMLEKRLAECIETDEAGRPTLTVTLPDQATLSKLSQSLAGLLAMQKTGGATAKK